MGKLVIVSKPRKILSSGGCNHEMGRLRGLPLPEHTEMDQSMQVVYHPLGGAKELEQNSLETSTTGSSKHTNWNDTQGPWGSPQVDCSGCEPQDSGGLWHIEWRFFDLGSFIEEGRLQTCGYGLEIQSWSFSLGHSEEAQKAVREQ